MATAIFVLGLVLRENRRLRISGVRKFADLVLLNANPLENIHNTQKIYAVVLAGKYCSREQLDELLRDVETSASASK